ncbi:AIPR protein [Candidatus Methylomirabilis lanthanidiphila]|uniref:AIPR protein n=1 Tax=Candidatus Methylomirabilis lanthanidiphila TaxID=2211376 RepID=A0A564ZEU3_9BACT|nr:AIPR protein [Candidatus Methylomirabilis lanthanidiphila]
MSTWKSAFTARTDLNRYGDNAIGLFALALRFGLEDLETVAAESLTDGSDDKKVDLVYIDRDESVAVIAQCYTSTKARDSAPANKASDLNTAVAWLLQRSIDDLPERLRSTAAELRECLIDGSVADLHVWYVHNLPESSNVHNEILTVESSLALALKSAFPGKEIGTQVLEVGNAKLDEWYADTQSPILVTDHFTIPIPDGFQMRAANWDAYVTAIPAKFLYTQYRKHKARLFSANVRDYLGSRKTDANINYGIKRTAADTPGDFWVYNNGLTLLVNDYTPEVRGARKYLKIHGLSIVNGAQTTGALGSLDRSPHQTALVPVRVVKTTDSETIFNIIQYNNSQNKIAAADFRSRDRIQKRLREEFARIPDAEYQGGRRGGHADAIKRNPRLLPSYTVGQALAAIAQDPVVASNEKSNIWASDKHYSKYFNDETTATHIVFAYSLLRAVEARKLSLVTKSKDAQGLTEVHTRELEFFRNRGATFLLVSAIASALETILIRRIPNVARLSFSRQCSPAKAEKLWTPIVEIVAPFCQQLQEAFTHGLKNVDLVKKSVQTFQSLVQSTATANASAFREFAKHVKVKTQAEQAR